MVFRTPPRPKARRCNVLAPSQRLVYREDSLIVVTGSDTSAWIKRLFTPNVVFSVPTLNALVAAKVPADEVASKVMQLLKSITAKRLQAGHSVVIETATTDAEERILLSLLAGNKPAHLIYLDGGPTQSNPQAAALLRATLLAGNAGEEGYATSLVLSPGKASEVRRIVLGDLAREED